MKKYIAIFIVLLAIIGLPACGYGGGGGGGNQAWSGSEGGGGSGGGKVVPPASIQRQLSYYVIDANMERECGASRIPPQFPPADFIKAYVELQNTDTTGGEFRVEFYFTTDERNYTDSDSAYIPAGETKTFHSEVKIEILETIELDTWYYEVTPPTVTI